MDRRFLAVGALVVLVALAGCATTSPGFAYETGPTAADLSEGGPDRGTAWQVTVTEVIDGDTVEARFPNGEVATLRFLGVDTPETDLERTSSGEFEGIPDTPAGRRHLAEWGERASRFVRDRLAGRTVRVAVDEGVDRRGGYGRLLVYVYTGEALVNERLLTAGYARFYESDIALRSQFRAAEATARTEDRGLWGLAGTTPTAARTAPRPGRPLESTSGPGLGETIAARVPIESSLRRDAGPGSVLPPW